MPCQTPLYLDQVAIQTVEQHLADLAPVPVNLDPFDNDRLIGDHMRKALPGDITECLPLFRRINAAQPDLVLGVGVVQNSDGVTISYLDDLAQQVSRPAT